MAKLGLADLEQIRERTRQTTLLREGAGRAKILVHMGTCGIAAGARKIIETTLREVEKKNLKDVLITTTGCAGLCSREPMVTVEIVGQPPIKYVDLTEEKIKAIITEHIEGNKIVKEYALAMGSEQML